MNKDNLYLLNHNLGQIKFQPEFYWTGDLEKDAVLINAPHIKAEGKQEDRIDETLEIMTMFQTKFEYIEEELTFDARDVFNIQNHYLKRNNYKGIVPGLRTHDVTFEGSLHYPLVPTLFYEILPVNLTSKEDLLLWYTVMQKIHPLSDLNGRVFGTIVALLYQPKK